MLETSGIWTCPNTGRFHLPARLQASREVHIPRRQSVWLVGSGYKVHEWRYVDRRFCCLFGRHFFDHKTNAEPFFYLTCCWTYSVRFTDRVVNSSCACLTTFPSLLPQLADLHELSLQPAGHHIRRQSISILIVYGMWYKSSPPLPARMNYGSLKDRLCCRGQIEPMKGGHSNWM